MNVRIAFGVRRINPADRLAYLTRRAGTVTLRAVDGEIDQAIRKKGRAAAEESSFGRRHLS
jgi:hypothetical protein